MKSIGRFLSSDSRRTALWPALSETPGAPSEPQPSEPERPNPHAISLDQLHGEVFVDLSKHPKVSLGPADAETHLDLAIAYREMALIGDAVEEAAVALRSEEHLTRPRAREALRLVFDRRHLRIDVEETLVALRKAMFAN